MRSPKSLHNLQHDEGGNYMAEAETEAETILGPRTVTLQCSLPSANIYDNANICNFLEICFGMMIFPCRYVD